MGGKKKGGKKKAAESKDGDGGGSIEDFRANYIKACKTLGIPHDSTVVQQLTPEEEGALTQFCSDADLGPAGVRALCAAILGKGSNMKGGPYKALKSLRLWRNNCRDAGAGAIADVLLHGLDLVQLTHLQLMDNQIGGPGCLALGEALMLGGNTSLMTLRLDHNVTMGTEGLIQLSKGLRTNHKLSSLYLSFCNIDHNGGKPLQQLLSFPASALNVLDLEGNHLGSRGLSAISAALRTNTALKKLILTNNGIGGDEDQEENKGAIVALGEALTSPTGGLEYLDMEMNSVEPDCAELLVPYLAPENKRVKTFKIDDNLPPTVFAQISRVDAGGGKKKKGKKGKGKKKKKK